MCLICILARCGIRVTVFPFIRLTRSKILNLYWSNRVLQNSQVQREADTIVAGRIEQCIGVLARCIYLLATPQQRVAVTQCYFLQAILCQLDLQVQREQTVDTTAVVARHRINRITIRAVLLQALAAPQVRYSRCNLILHTVNRLAVEREVQDIQLFDIFSITEDTCLANRIAVYLRLACFEATPQYRITVARRQCCTVVLNYLQAEQDTVATALVMCLICILARCGIRVTVYPIIRLTRSKVLNLNRSNRVLLHGQVQRIMHAVVCRIQHTLERVVIRAGLIQQLTTPQQRVGSAYY